MHPEFKTVTLIRHAKAEQAEKGMSDMDRPLKQKGEKQAARLAKWLKANDFHPDLMWCSPAVRTHMSARIILDYINAPLSSLCVRKRLYQADASDILSMIHKAAPEIKHLAIIGHNPAMADLIDFLSSSKHAKIPPATICTIDFAVSTWAEVLPGSGITRHFITPSMLEK